MQRMTARQYRQMRKRRNRSKDNMILPIYKKWGFEHDSDNVRDAYVLARIGYDMHSGGNLLKYEKEIINNLRKEV